MIHTSRWTFIAVFVCAQLGQALLPPPRDASGYDGPVWSPQDSYVEIPGFYHVHEEPRLPSILSIDTTFARQPGQIALFDASTDFDREPIRVAPHRTVTLYDLPVTSAVQQQTWLSGGAEGGDLEYHEWFSFFQLQGNATLILQDLVVHINPVSPLQASTPAGLSTSQSRQLRMGQEAPQTGTEHTGMLMPSWSHNALCAADHMQ